MTSSTTSNVTPPPDFGAMTVSDALRTAVALHQQGRLGDAERLYQAVLRVVPNQFDALHLCGLAQAQQGRPLDALDCLDRAAAVNPASAEVHGNRANVLKSLQRHDDALANCDRSLALNPGVPEVLNLRGAILLDMQRCDEALVDYARALALKPQFAEALYNQALTLQTLGRWDEALASYDATLAIDAGFVPALHNRGSVLRDLKRYDAALASWDLALARKPDFAEAWNNRGGLLRDMGRFDEALASCDRAVTLNPRLAEALNNRGGAMKELHRYDDAIESCTRALAIKPALAEAYFNRAMALHATGRSDDALADLAESLRLKPRFAEAMHTRGAIQHGRNELDAALASFDGALVLDPHLVAALNGRAGVLKDLQRYGEALASWDRALEIAPDSSELHHNRGSALAVLQRHDEAVASYGEALRLRPDFVQALHNQVAALSALGRYGEALSNCNRAIALLPDYAEAHHNRGSALSALNHYEEAVASYTQALILKTDFTASLQNRGSVLAFLGRHEEAARDFARALAIEPDFAYTKGMLVNSRLHCCDWQGYDEMVRNLVASAEAGERCAEPFAFLIATDTAAAQLACARTYVADKCPPASPRLWNGERYAHDRIRVAYVSADLHEHATAHLMAGMFECHDASRFDTYGISFGPDAPSPMRDRLRAAFGHFIDARERTAQGIAELLRELEIDIAVDLKGFTYDARTEIFAARPAPIQVNYLGYPGTMGADYFDYVIADGVVIPESSAKDYAEHVVRLPDSYQVNDARRHIAPQTPTRHAAGLPATGFVFCSFNNTYKITPQVFDVWMRLLARVDGSVLWLLEGNAAAPVNLRREAVARGIAPDRLVFARRINLSEHLARHRLADLFLDTLPINAHTTASDALWAGLPLVTSLGATFAGRVAGSLLRAVGLPELATSSLDAYEQLALQLATDQSRLAGIRAVLARNRERSPLFDTLRFTRHIEQAYETMWRRLQDGAAPASFAVSPLAP